MVERVRNQSLIVVLMLVMVVVGCSTGDLKGSSGYSQGDVAYTLNCGGVECYNTNQQRTYDLEGGHMKQCLWYCGNYKGKNRKYVLITFSKFDKSVYPYTGTDCWGLDSEYISEERCK